MDKRPPIQRIKSSAELQNWYWLKEELVAYCRKRNISYTGGKFQLSDRIGKFLDDGKKNSLPEHVKISSSFDWHSATLTLHTIITDSYRNTQNVRRFFTEHCGNRFHFNIPFMEWMKKNIGKQLKYAVTEWKHLEDQKKKADFKSKIPAHNQYNQYIRDFFANNPDRSMKEARACWKLKKLLPGKTVYSKTDFFLR